MNSQRNSENITTEQILETLNVYLQEYIYRDTHMWNQNFRFFFASLVVMFLPNLTEGFGITIPDIFLKNSWVFPTVGVILAIVFLYVSLSLAKRFQAISKTYNKLINMLPEDLRRISIKNLPYKFLNKTHIFLIPILMFTALIVLGILGIIQ